MIKEMLCNKIENLSNVVSISTSCMGAVVDTIRDQEVKEIWKVKRTDIKAIDKECKEKLQVLYNEYAERIKTAKNTAKINKKIVNNKFNGIIKQKFDAYLSVRIERKFDKKQTDNNQVNIVSA